MTVSPSSPRYTAYGLIFVCDFALPELPLAPDGGAAPDVEIELGDFLALETVEQALASDADVTKSIHFEARRCRILFTRVGRFTISEGRHILLEPVQGRGPDLWRLPLLGAVLALLLEQRSFFVLHAGALDMGGFAACFLGHKGQGKSTLNAALTLAGYPLLSDDVVALQWPDSRPGSLPSTSPTPPEPFPLTLCGFGQIKLVPDAVRALLQSDPDQWPAVAPELAEVNKRAFQARLAPQALPLKHLFVLTSLPEMENSVKSEEGGGDIRLRRLAPQEAFAQIWPHTYGARFGDYYLKNERKKTHFTACARLVGQCQVWELARRRDLALLPATIEAIARQVGANASPAPRNPISPGQP